MFKSILVATDGSDHAKKAVALASELAANSEGRLLLIYVIEQARLAPDLEHMAEVEHLLDSTPALADRGEARGITPAGLALVKDNAVNSRRAMRALAEHIVAQAKRSATGPGIDRIDIVVEEGSPAERIIECAKRENVELIVLGSRGRSDLEGLLLGSVSHKVCHLAPCSCITVR